MTIAGQWPRFQNGGERPELVLFQQRRMTVEGRGLVDSRHRAENKIHRRV